MKQTISLALGVFAICVLACIGAAHAVGSPYEVEYTNDAPLMVIRFNQPHVAYEQPLYKTLSRALEVKPTAVFDIVSVSAKARDPQAQKVNNEIATQNVHKVLNTLKEIGMPQSRINLSSASDNIASSEVRVFVH